MGSGCSKSESRRRSSGMKDNDYDTTFREVPKKKVISRARHSLTVSNHSDGLDASVRFVARKNPSQLRPDHNDDNGNLSLEERNSLLDGSVEGHRVNPFALKQTGNDESGNQEKTLIKPPLLGNTATMDELNLGRKLGSGTYGTVYSANFTGMHGFLADKVIAAKVLKVPRQKAERERLIIDFEQEINILQRVQHPRILLFLGTICQPNTSDYVIMTELLAGNVCQVLKKTKETGKAISWDIATQM